MRSLLAGLFLGALCGIVLVGVAAYPDRGIDPSYPPNDLYVVSDTVCCNPAYTDTIVPDGGYVLYWWVYVPPDTTNSGVSINFSPADDRLDGSDMLMPGAFTLYEDDTFICHVPIDTLYIQGVSASGTKATDITYQVFIEQLKAQ